MRTLPVSLTYLGITLMAAWPLPSFAACTINSTAGNDTSTCDSGAAPGFTDIAGNNTLNLSGSGVLNGNVSFGAGNDQVEINGATAAINGALDQGDGANSFRLTLGTVTGGVTQGDGADLVQISGGQAGAIIQGGGVDNFVMSAGTVESVAQGDGHDTFTLTGGTIKAAFEDGDQALMTGGTIGRVDMKLDNNVFDMRGGTIVGNLVTGLGRDTILVSGASTIGGNISTSAGVDLIQVSGGRVNGQILTSFGADQFIWTDGGTIGGAILMGADDDSALLKNLSETLLAPTPQLDGGLGNDTLTFDATHTSIPSRYTGWEQVRLVNGSILTLGGTFVLGGSDTATGAMSIDATSRLSVTTGVLSPFAAGQLATLNNAGLIDMSTGSASATDSLTVNGNYMGTGGRLALQTVLGADNSPSDKLVVSQGTLQGTTAISVTNLGGAGALTVQDGIEVVQATQGATSSAGAFALAGPVSAGAYDYHLFRGGRTAGTEQNYYLRSTVPALPAPGAAISPPTPAPGTPALPPSSGNTAIPLYRAEVPVYAAQFQAAEQIVQGMLGTYHERVGDQNLQRQTGAFPAGWARAYGGNSRQSFAGTVSPTLDSSLSAFQVGSDVYATTTDSGQTYRLGFFVGHSRLQGDVKGFNGGFQGKDAGSLTLRGDSLGVYWTLIGANRAYLDVVLMGTRLTGNNESDRGIKTKTKGSNALASAEVGRPFTLGTRWELEPQAQLIVDRTRLDSQNDRISAISYDADTHVTTRLGARLRGSYEVSGMPLQPYVRANVWHARAGTNTVRFDDATDIDTEQKSTTLDLNLGATLTVAQGISLYGQLGYKRNLDSNRLSGRQGTLGLRMAF